MLALTLVAVIALRSPNGLPLEGKRDVTVDLENPGNLQAHNDVRINGVRVGQVIAIRRTTSGGAAVKLRLEPSVEPLPVDSQVALRGSGLLGARYVELKPGSSAQTLGDGATLRTRGDVLTNGIPDALNTLDPKARASLSTATRELGAAVLGRGQLFQRAIGVAPEVGVDLKEIFRAPLQRPGAAGRLLPSLERAATALRPAAGDIARGIAAGRRALQPFADRAHPLGRSLQQAPSALRQAQRGLGRGTALIAAAGSLARAANRTLPPVPAGLRATTTLLRRSPRPLRRTDRLLAGLSTATPPTVTAAKTLKPLLTPIRRLSSDLVPIVRRLAPRACDIDNFAENWRSMVAFGVPRDGQSTLLPSGKIGGLSALKVTVLVDGESIEGTSTPDPSGISETYPAPCVSSPGPVYSQTAVGR